jgi:hypothetical protein
MKKRMLRSPTLYKTYKWFLENVSDDVLKARGCDVNTIALMHTIHEEIVNGQSHQNIVTTRKITILQIRFMENLYKGVPKHTSEITKVYSLLLQGVPEPSLLLSKFSNDDIQKAMRFRDEYAHRDMFSKLIARELEITEGSARRMQKITQNSFLGS